MNSYQLNYSYNDSLSFRWDYFGMDNWADKEIKEYNNNYAYFGVKVVNALHEKFNIPFTWDYSSDDDGSSEESEDSWDEDYQKEAWANYGQFKDVY